MIRIMLTRRRATTVCENRALFLSSLCPQRTAFFFFWSWFERTSFDGFDCLNVFLVLGFVFIADAPSVGVAPHAGDIRLEGSGGSTTVRLHGDEQCCKYKGETHTCCCLIALVGGVWDWQVKSFALIVLVPWLLAENDCENKPKANDEMDSRRLTAKNAEMRTEVSREGRCHRLRENRSDFVPYSRLESRMRTSLPLRRLLQERWAWLSTRLVQYALPP